MSFIPSFAVGDVVDNKKSVKSLNAVIWEE